MYSLEGREGEEKEGRKGGERQREYEYDNDNEPKRGFGTMATDVAKERDMGHIVRTWQKNNQKMPDISLGPTAI